MAEFLGITYIIASKSFARSVISVSGQLHAWLFQLGRSVHVERLSKNSLGIGNQKNKSKIRRSSFIRPMLLPPRAKNKNAKRMPLPAGLEPATLGWNLINRSPTRYHCATEAALMEGRSQP